MWLCFSCRELSTSLQREGYGPLLLFGVRADRCRVTSEGSGCSARCHSSQRGCTGTASWVPRSGLAIEDCLSMQVRRAVGELFLCWKWASCTTILRDSEESKSKARASISGSPDWKEMSRKNNTFQWLHCTQCWSAMEIASGWKRASLVWVVPCPFEGCCCPKSLRNWVRNTWSYTRFRNIGGAKNCGSPLCHISVVFSQGRDGRRSQLCRRWSRWWLSLQVAGRMCLISRINSSVA